MYSLLRPLLFKLKPEFAHHLALKALAWYPTQSLSFSQPVDAMGFRFAHPIGLAAGLDKNGCYINGLSKLGFSFLEIGTVTLRPQAGNPKPRLFRLPAANALINRLGFNNEGVDALVARLQASPPAGIIGINIGKNKDTSLEHAVTEYRCCLQKVYAHASYVTINISSPNTPDLRQLQQDAYLEDLLKKISDEQKKLSDAQQRLVPILVKFSPDESIEALKRMTAIVLQHSIAGIIISNTTLARPGVQGLADAAQAGGLSGQPLFESSTECLRVIKSEAGNQLTLIGVGGIQSAADACLKLAAGADLLQIYTGLIYQGPGLVKELVEGLQNIPSPPRGEGNIHK